MNMDLISEQICLSSQHYKNSQHAIAFVDPEEAARATAMGVSREFYLSHVELDSYQTMTPSRRQLMHMDTLRQPHQGSLRFFWALKNSKLDMAL